MITGVHRHFAVNLIIHRVNVPEPHIYYPELFQINVKMSL
jgi:hypothetical protein